MLKQATIYLIVIFSCGLTAWAWGQQGNRSTSSAYELLPAGADLSAKRENDLAEQLRRMRDTEAVMGDNHPQRDSLRKRIAEAQAYLDNLRSVPNPFRQFEEQGVEPRDIVEQLSEKDLRVLLVRLAIDMKDLRERVAVLEERTSSKRQ
jgi:hypothetical protein